MSSRELFISSPRCTQGCQFGFFEARFQISGFFKHVWLFLKIKKRQTKSGFFQSERLGSGKTLSELHIHYKPLLKKSP